ncbi:glycosyltransferase family 4 protein [Hanstruepera ponticola]|uniref:glycosyltransferase family 4 protein n=1 Tax=Hanstruepera ponticola TaxID=2042995 RepID=UPI001968F2C6|nr:glycosyltransferase family 4 protein [Hanstruepera ponticola]
MTIAIYSGEIPSTTFIERLIKGLSNESHEIFLFGIKRISLKYPKVIKVIGYKENRLSKALHLLKYTLLLFFFKRKEKCILDALLKDADRNTLNDKVKSYPVLWHKPDIFHLQWAKGIGDWMWVQKFGMKLVVSLRGAHINYSPIADVNLAKLYKQTFPKVDAFHAVSESIGIESEKYGALKDIIKVVYSGLDLNDFNLDKQTKTGSCFNIISVGRPHWIKGYKYALDACSILKSKNFMFKYIIIGAANNVELMHQIHDLNLQEQVVLLNKMPLHEVKKYINNSDLLLLPSTKEGLANVVLEAMALKTLVLSTDCGGVEEVIVNDKNGFLAPIRDSVQMANSILAISKLDDRRKTEVLNEAYSTIIENHNERQMVLNMIQIYNELMS